MLAHWNSFVNTNDTLHSCSKSFSVQETCLTLTSYSQWELYLIVKLVRLFPGSSGTLQIDWINPMRQCSVCYRKAQTVVDLQFLFFHFFQFIILLSQDFAEFLCLERWTLPEPFFIGSYLVTVDIIVSWLCFNQFFVLQHDSLPAPVILA